MMRTHIAPAAALFFVAPLFGEYLLGNLKFSELALLPLLAPLYGAGALLIREASRRAGRGYATVLVLGVAYAVFEEGLVDQMLFNPNYFPGQGEQLHTIVPQLGLDVWLTLIVVAMHAVWSITIPIVLIEAIFVRRGTALWLSNSGLAATAAVFVLGSAWLTHTVYGETGFLASWGQLAGAAIAVVAGTAAAFRFKQRPAAPGRVPPPWVVGGVAFAASSLYMLSDSLPGWSRVVACLGVAALTCVAVFRWSHRAAWRELHTVALAGGGLFTYAWLGAVVQPHTGPRTAVDRFGFVLIVVTALCLLGAALWQVSRQAARGSAETPYPTVATKHPR